MVMRKMGCYWGWLIFHTVLMTIWWWLFPAVNLRLNLYVVFDGFWHMWGTIVVDLCGPGHGHMTSAESPRSRVSSRAISHPERMEARNGWLVTMCDGQYFRSYEEHWRSRVMKNNGIWMECIYIYGVWLREIDKMLMQPQTIGFSHGIDLGISWGTGM